MEKNCLLCLEKNDDFINYLNLYEAKCGEYHAVSLIEKHLWPVTALKSQSQWLCSMCWKALREFHQFYGRIENTQTYFDHEIKSEHITTPEHNLFELDNGTVEIVVVKNEITDEESIGPIDNSKPEFYSTLLQDEKKPRRKFSKKISDVCEEFNNKSSPDIRTNFVADLFKCLICDKLFSNQKVLAKHTAWHKGTVCSCEICDLKFFDLSTLIEHKRVHAPNEKILKLINQEETMEFQCKYCINIYDNKQSCLNHISWHEDKLYYCTICNMKFLNASIFYHHKSSHELNNPQLLDTTKETEVSQHEITQNEVNHPNQEEKLSIRAKTKKSKRSKDLSLNAVNNNNTTDAHETELSNSDCLQLIKVECTYCCKVLENERVLLNHLAWHEDNVFHCKVCELKFFDKYKYQKHNAAHTYEVVDIDDEIEIEYLECSICSKVLKSRRQFLNHNAWHVGTIYACEICDLQFLDKTKYEDHQNKHLPKSWKRCRDCGKAFASARYVKSHWLKMHRNKFIQVCDVCGMVYRCPEAFKRHTDKHLGQLEDTKIPCDICGRLLKGKRSLKTHKRINHPKDGILPYVCHICFKPIATRALLNTHITARHGPKDSRFKCLICDKAFRTSSHLKEHRFTHSVNKANIPCQWCSKMLSSTSVLSRHRRKFHPKEYAEWKDKLFEKI